MHRVRFEDVEIEAQSVEVLLAEAAGSQFQPSADDVDVPLFLLEAFSSRILERARERRQVGLPNRADKFRVALWLERNRTRMLVSGG
jgi:elongation factor P hydroxylase